MAAFYENKQNDLYIRDSDLRRKNLSYTSHLHYHVEIALVKAGRTRVTVDNYAYTVNAGDVIVVFPNQVHQFETLKPEQYVLMIINPDIVSEFTKLLTICVPKSNIIVGGAEGELWDLAKKISEEYSSEDSYSNEILYGYLIAFFGRIFQKLSLRDIDSKESNVLGLIMNYCVNNHDKALSLDMLEKELHISKYYISHIMSNKLNMGFNEYINSIRISNACKYLRKTDRSITEISDLAGFNTLRTFNRAFRRQMGMTPSEYRDKLI